MTVGFTGRRAFAPLVFFSLAMAGCATAPTDRQTPAPQPDVVQATAPASAGAAAAVPAAPPAPSSRAAANARALPVPASDAQNVEADLAAQDEGADGDNGIGADALAGTNSHTVAGLTPEQYPDVFDRMRAGFKLDDIDSPRIDQQLAFYANNPAYLERVFGRAGVYLHHIVQEIEARGMPLELALLPVVESAFEPYAQSWVRANGLWQFMPGTGERFGLKQD